MTDIAQRLHALRQEMARLNVDALFIPRADQYLGEYIPERNERLRWASGFTGSAGVAIVLRDRAAIFVDGRYTVQVRRQVPEDQFEILHLVETPHVAWLAEQMPQGARAAYDPRMHPLSWQQEAAKTLSAAEIELVELVANPVDACWDDRPQDQVRPALLLPEQLTGRSSLDKRRDIGAAISAKGAEAALVFAADSCAWLLNIRGQDVPCLPVVLGFSLLFADGRMQFFTDPAKIPVGFHDHVGSDVEILPESAAPEAFRALAGKSVLADPVTANAWSQLELERAGAKRIAADDPVVVPKACKNAAEIEGMKQAHLRDGVAVVRFLAWLDREVDSGHLHSEGDLSDRLHAIRSEGQHFKGPSFDTISAAAGNAAMCHYNHLNFDQVSHLHDDSVYLVDSGGQYLDGTTDITRTVAIGDPGDEVRRRFTLVLKGHISLDQAVFPEGTNGTQLDILARQHLWRDGLDYDHGTGHGVGSFLSVHEGPQRICKPFNRQPLEPGMVLSNEPGYYKDDRYGMRCENLVVVQETSVPHTDGPKMRRFEAITLAPFDTRLLEPTLLTPDEKSWLNAYHARVNEALSPLLPAADREWLKKATAAI